MDPRGTGIKQAKLPAQDIVKCDVHSFWARYTHCYPSAVDERVGVRSRQPATGAVLPVLGGLVRSCIRHIIELISTHVNEGTSRASATNTPNAIEVDRQ